MDKKLGVLLVVLLVVSLFVINIQSASADADVLSNISCSGDEDCFPGERCDVVGGYCVYDDGGNSAVAAVDSASGSLTWGSFKGLMASALGVGGKSNGKLTEKDMGALSFLTKWMMLILVILLIYSAMSAAKFPSNTGLRFVLSLVIGFLSVIMINNSEIITLLESYKALGITVAILLPMIALVFITYSVAVSMNSFGILLQRLAWFVYAIFLFVKIGTLLLFKSIDSFANSWVGSPLLTSISKFLYGKTADGMIEIAKGMDTIVMIILVVVTIAVFIWFVIMNEKTVSWIANATQVSDLDRYKDKVERSSGKVNVDAEATKK